MKMKIYFVFYEKEAAVSRRQLSTIRADVCIIGIVKQASCVWGMRVTIQFVAQFEVDVIDGVKHWNISKSHDRRDDPT